MIFDLLVTYTLFIIFFLFTIKILLLKLSRKLFIVLADKQNCYVFKFSGVRVKHKMKKEFIYCVIKNTVF